MDSSKSISSWETIEGSGFPLGVNYLPSENAFNFAIYSHHASMVRLLVFSKSDLLHPIFTYEFDYRINKSNRVWHCRINAELIRNGTYYGYQVDGPPPKNQFEWHAFDKEKLLLDPYAKAVYFPPDFNKEAASKPGQNFGQAPLGILFFEKEEEFDWQDDQFIEHKSDLIIYELHIRGFTQHETSSLVEERGCYAGIVKKIPYLLELGITAVELMPVHQFDIHNSYWGYNTLNFFSAHCCYSCSDNPAEQIREFKTMVRELHKAGIEVILDVVYNHTAEGDHTGPTYSFKGIDNSSYYLISNDLPNAPYLNFTGTGNTIHTRNSAVRRLILDSLHYWRTEMHVDGFRFDLASVFSRNIDGSISFHEPAVLGMIASDGHLANARFIAEPWDATGTMSLGKKFPGMQWMQWNSLFKDDVRRFVRGDNGFIGQVINRIYGSEDLFPDDLLNAFHSYQSINYINSHDGFTLYDLISYNEKHNEANGENNHDGASNNFSWNCGTEGEVNVSEEILQLRKKQGKNLAVILFISNGIPMFVAGDEFLRTQKGNNNPYNQDNDVSWIDWSFKDKNGDFFKFFKNLISFRKRHPSLSRSRFWRSDIEWFGVNKRNVDVSYTSHALAFCIKPGIEKDTNIYVMINCYYEPLSFCIQTPGHWSRIINTSYNSPNDFVAEGEDLITSSEYQVSARSIVVLVEV